MIIICWRLIYNMSALKGPGHHKWVLTIERIVAIFTVAK